MSERPIYETDLDRAREERIIHLYAAKDGLLPRRCPRMYPCDWLLENPDTGELVALVEVKARAKAYPEYMISLNKAARIVSLAAYADARAVLVVYWADEQMVGACDLMTCQRRAGFGGRRDRNDSEDVEPVALIPRGEFTAVQHGISI